MAHSLFRTVFSVSLVTVLASGCIPIMVGAGAGAVGTSAMQERTVGGAVDDTTILTGVKGKYLGRDINHLFHAISVEVHEGRVLLVGKVKRPEDKREAARLAWQIEGVKEVINELEVTNAGETAEDEARDTWITTQLRSQLLVEKNVKSINYVAETEGGTVYLLGIAQDDVELNKVKQIASRIKGVKRVVSHVRLKNDPKRGLNEHQQPATSTPQ